MLTKRFFNWCLPLLLVLTTCCSCKYNVNNDKVKVRIDISNDSETVVVHQLDYAILHDLKNDSLTPEAWRNFFPVYRMPPDTDTKDFVKAQPGKYLVTDSLIIFKPDTPFKKHQLYFTRFYQQGLLKSQVELMQAKSNLNGPKYQEVLLHF